MYPIIFNPIYKKMIWGGERLRTIFDRSIPDSTTGESWDVSCREKEMGIVENGSLAGKTFIEVINSDRERYLGKALMNQEVFPLLVKIIDAKDDLSIQVHPSDTYARQNEADFYGKTEMWYILDEGEEGSLVIGLKDGVTREELDKALTDGSAEALFDRLPVKKGDIVNIPAGLIHAITKGVMLAEIQQNSDITYRVYDYNRPGLDGKPRELHVKKALDVADFDGKLSKNVTNGLTVSVGGGTVTYAIANNYFAIEKYQVKTELTAETDGNKFCVYTCVGGEAEFVTGDGKTVLQESRSVFIPAAMGNYTIRGECTLLKSYVPNVADDFIKPLKEAGYSDEDIRQNCAVELQ